MRLYGNLNGVSYATEMSAGCDVRARNRAVINPGERVLISTGLYISEGRPNEAVWVTSKSGLAARYGVVVLNSPGLIDADYPGEIGVILINHGSEPYTVNIGDKIAQLVLVKIDVFGNILPENQMRTGGFGSTGN